MGIGDVKYNGATSVSGSALAYTESDISPLKYNEHMLTNEILHYIESTYNQHYVGEDNVQYMDIVMSDDFSVATGFLKHNAGKYINRLGKKDGYNRKDILKAIHYMVLMMHLIDSKGQKVGLDEIK